MPVTVGGVTPTTPQQEAFKTAFGIPVPVEVGPPKATLAGGDRIIGLNSESGFTPFEITLASLAAYVAATIDAGPIATEPAALVIGDWSVVNGDGVASVTIDTAPNDNGSAIIDYEYRLDEDDETIASLATAVIGTFPIPGMVNGVNRNVQLRAVNGVTFAAWSDVKVLSPQAAAPSGGVTPVAVSAVQDEPYSDVWNVNFAEIADGHTGLVVFTCPAAAGVPDSVIDDTAGVWVELFSHPGSEGVAFRYYCRENVSDGPVSLQIEFAEACGGSAFAMALPTASITLDDSDGGFQAQTDSWDFPFESSVPETLLVCAAALANEATATGTPPLTALPGTPSYGFFAYGVIEAQGVGSENVGLSVGLQGDKASVLIREGV